jgi:O-antigen ligase
MARQSAEARASGWRRVPEWLWPAALLGAAAMVVLSSPMRAPGPVSAEEALLLGVLAAFAVLGRAGLRWRGELRTPALFFASCVLLSSAAALLAETGGIGGVLREELWLRLRGIVALDQLEIYQVPRAALLLVEGLGVLGMASLVLRSGRARRLAAWTLLGLGALIAAQGLYERTTGHGLPEHWLNIEPELRRVGGLFGDPNVLGSVACLLLPLAAYGASGGGRPRRLAAGLVLAGLASVLLLSWSRAALGAAVLWCLVEGLRAAGAGRRRALPVLAAAAALALGTAWMAGAAPLEAWLQKTLGRHSAEEVLGGRLELWASGGRMVRDFPLLGSGPGSTYRRYAQYARPGSAAAEGVHAEPGLEGRNLHNYYLQTAAETGLLGLAGLLWVLGAVLAGALRGEGWSRAAGTGALLFLVTGLTGHPFLDRAAAVLFWLVCGLAAAGAREGRSPRARRGAWAVLLLGGTLQMLLAWHAGQGALYELGLHGNPGGWRTLEELRITGPPPERGRAWWWTGRRAELSVVPRAGVARIPVAVRHPRMEQDPVIVSVRVDGELRLLRRYTRPGTETLEVALLPSERRRPVLRLQIEVSRVWIPSAEGRGEDSRRLGLALARLQWTGPEAWGGLHAPEAGHRWSRLYFEGRMRRDGPQELELEVSHPGLEIEPLEVRLFWQERQLEAVRVPRPGRVRLELGAELRAGDPVRVELSRTWSPAHEGLSADTRELGARLEEALPRSGPLQLEPDAADGP